MNFKIKCNLETEITKLFESRKKDAAITTPGAKVIFAELPYMYHEQFKLKNNFRQHIETIMTPNKVLSMGIKKNPLQKTCKI